MPPLRFERTVLLDAPPGALWPSLSDTDRLNRAVGLPKVSYEPPPPGGVVRRASATQFGVIPLAWDEHPFDWVENDHYLVERVFRGGPLERVKGGMRFERDGGRTAVRVTAEAEPRGAMGAVAARVALQSSLDGMARLVEQVGAAVAGRGPDPLRPTRACDTVDVGRLVSLLEAAGPDVDAKALARIREHILTAADHDAALMRPYELADRWGLDRCDVLRAFLHACRAGALDMRWELLCPHCRVAKAAVGSLKDFHAQGRCDFCNCDITAQLDTNVEVRFAPNASVRPVSAGVFCIGGPANSRHRPAQVRLAAGETRALTVPLKAQRYVVQGLLSTRTVRLVPDPAGAERLSVRFEGGSAQGGELRFRPGDVTLELANAGADAWAVVQQVEWSDTAATAAAVANLQDFRDLFSAEVLAPGTEVSVRSLALLFTDLRGSTAMYERVGDARAYAVVREHFTVLFDVVRRRRGAVVKTIGDAVMAAFVDPADAVAAALEMHEGLLARNKSLPEPVVLKVGVHAGPAIAINADGSLDYFGTTVNLAARVQAESLGGDVVLTEPALAAPRAAAALAGGRREAFETHVKGLSAAVRLVRYWPPSSISAGLAPPGPKAA